MGLLVCTHIPTLSKALMSRRTETPLTLGRSDVKSNFQKSNARDAGHAQTGLIPQQVTPKRGG